ncbi:MAG: MarR family transcriptional regulator [Clostridia bacterium]|nr:MarR family transcriptional regulator [Clostridia bacterium]
MNERKDMFEQLKRFYSLWKESNSMYEEWAKENGLSSNSVLILYSLYEEGEECTQKTISQKWSIPKQTVNTILKDFTEKGYIELYASCGDKRSKLLKLTQSGRMFAAKVIEALHEKELFVIEKMGVENVKKMNDDTEMFINLFRNGGKNENN